MFLQPRPRRVPYLPAAVRAVHSRSAGEPHPAPPEYVIAFLLPTSPILTVLLAPASCLAMCNRRAACRVETAVLIGSILLLSPTITWS